MKVGFAGLGAMGSGMARNLIKAGNELTVYNRTRSKAEKVAGANAKVAGTPGEAAAGAEAVITMLADDSAVENAVFGEGNILESLRAGATHISMGTISVALSRRLRDAHKERNQNYLAAPVFGRPDAAAAAKLFIVAAGESVLIEKFRSLFEAMGQKLFVASDDAPAANVIKLTGNFMITVVIEALAESFALMRRSGIDQEKFLEIMTGSLFAAPVYVNYGQIVAKEKFEPAGFKLPLGLKDNRLVRAAAEEVAVPLPLANLINERFISAIAQGLSESDWSAIAKVTYRNAGLE